MYKKHQNHRKNERLRGLKNLLNAFNNKDVYKRQPLTGGGYRGRKADLPVQSYEKKAENGFLFARDAKVLKSGPQAVHFWDRLW